MPKIPTFKSRERITGEVSSVTSDISVSPFRTTGAAIASVARAAEDYYIKERSIKEKTEATKAFLELSSELDTIQEGASNQFDIEEANNVFQNQSQFLLKEKLSKAKNKRVKNLIQSEFDLDQIERKIKIKQDVRSRLDEEFEYNNKVKKEQNFSRYKIAKTPNEKRIIKEGLFSDEESNGMSLGDSAITIQKNKDIIRQDLLVTDVEQLIENRRYETALNILKDIDNTPFLESEERSKLLDTLNDEYNTVLADENISNILNNKLGILTVGAQLENVDGTIITNKELEKGLNIKAQSRNYTPAQIIELSINNGAAVPLYKSIINGGSSNISDTGNKELTKQGLEYFKLFKIQNGFNSLKSIYKIDKETLESYERINFAINRMNETFDSAFAREVDIKNKPESYRLRTIDDKKIDKTFSDIDMPGLFLGDIQNVQTTKYLLKNISNIYYKAGGSQEDALEGAKEFIEQNYRMDLFNQIVPRDNSLPEYHDAAIKTYIKKIYDEGRINKETNKLDDIIPVYYSLGEFSDVQGIILKNKTNDQTVSIGASIPVGDFDEVTYDSARLTQKDIVKKIYPLEKDLIYAGNVKKYKLLQDKRNKLIELSKPLVESGFGKPIK